eukprot:jgi/Botrbrau1/13289/Bobra.27_2s0009.1
MAQMGPGSVMGFYQNAVHYCVLEYLLEQDELTDQFIKMFCDYLNLSEASFPPIVQLRLMFRVLGGSIATVTPATLQAVGCLKAVCVDPTRYPPTCDVMAAAPSPDLLLQVKTELVVRALRPGYEDGASAQELLDQYFPADNSIGDVDRQRRNELQAAFGDEEKVALLQQTYLMSDVQGAITRFIADGRAKLGPPLIKLMDQQCRSGAYYPYMLQGPSPLYAFLAMQNRLPQGQPILNNSTETSKKPPKQPPKRKRKSAGDGVAGATLVGLDELGKKLGGLGGADPLLGVLAQADQATQDQGSFSQAVAEAASSMSLIRDTNEARPVVWSLTPQDMMPFDPSQLQLPGLGVQGGPLSPNSAEKKVQRRKNGRWAESETQLLINLVKEFGKGKWKRILEEGGSQFQNRSQVDLKDKWRNLERQKVVGPQDVGPQDQQTAAHESDLQEAIADSTTAAMDVGPPADALENLPGLANDGLPVHPDLDVSRVHMTDGAAPVEGIATDLQPSEALHVAPDCIPAHLVASADELFAVPDSSGPQ